MSLRQNSRRRNPVFHRISVPHSLLDPHFDPYEKLTAKRKSHPTGTEFSVGGSMLLPKYSLIAYSSEKHNDFHAAESCPTPVLLAALPHTVTHMGKRTDGAHGAKSFRPHLFCGKNARKALYTNGWRPFYHLVRMRSAVRIRPAAPSKPCNHNGYRACFILLFLGFVGLSNRFSNRLLLCLFLQCRNDQFGNVGIFLEQTVCLFRCIIQRLFLRRISPFLEEIRLHLLGQPAALLVVGMGVEICHHTGLCVAGITLHRLDVPAADLQLQ